MTSCAAMALSGAKYVTPAWLFSFLRGITARKCLMAILKMKTAV